MKFMGMEQLQEGERAVVQTLELDGAIRRRMQDLGLIPGTEVRCLHRSPCGDPAAYLIRGAVIAVRACDAAKIRVQAVEA